jgi:cell division protein FtsQ
MGWAGVVLLFGTTIITGTTLGGHWQGLGDLAASTPEAFARGSGFTIDSIEVEGRKILTNDEILTALAYEPGRSLVMLDVTAARAALMQNPLVLQASVRKIYPDRLLVTVTEREPFALWQQGEKLAVISADGTVIEGVQNERFAKLPLVVGAGANTAARSILKAMEPYPELKERVYAAVRVGARRWNLRLANGMDIKLPEDRLDEALAQLVEFDRTDKITDRDIAEVDLRLPGRATVRLSDEAAAALAEAAKDKTKRAGT